MKHPFSNLRLWAGISIALFVLLFSFLGPFFWDKGEYEIFYVKDGAELARGADLTQSGITIHSLSKPTLSHPLGTDKEGRDIMVRLMYGGQISITVALFTILIQGLFGAFLGGLAGYYGKWADESIMRLVDVVNCIPDFPVILIFSAFAAKAEIPPQYKIYILVMIIAFFGAMRITRVVRGQVLFLKEQDFVLSATAIGLGAYRKITGHILPNVIPQLMVLSILGIGTVILTESALSFLGFGLPYPYASWGNMMTSVSDISILAKHANVWLPSGILIFSTVLSFHLMGEVMEDTL